MARPKKQPTPEERIKKLEQDIVNLKAELDNERGMGKNVETELYRRLEMESVKIVGLRLSLSESNRNLIELRDQNIALRNALKVVL
jgi:hypothetical protein